MSETWYTVDESGHVPFVAAALPQGRVLLDDNTHEMVDHDWDAVIEEEASATPGSPPQIEQEAAPTIEEPQQMKGVATPESSVTTESVQAQPEQQVGEEQA